MAIEKEGDEVLQQGEDGHRGVGEVGSFEV